VAKLIEATAERVTIPTDKQLIASASVKIISDTHALWLAGVVAN
jgi:hypothetical protein